MHDITPYEHIAICTQLQNDIDESLGIETEDNEFMLVLSHDEADAVNIALMLYKAFLLDKHKDRLKKEIDERIDGNANK
ncbi:MAG: hypothetical protein NC177_18130 [Ruminococcus flavefaciens]|nr:hypothetical protein [Ruminococcus flavefaciens]